MNVKDKISKLSYDLLNAAKDSVVNSLTTAVQEKKLNLSTADFQLILQLVSSSIDAGFHRAYSVFSRSLDEALKGK